MQTASPAFAAHMLLADQRVAQRVLINLPANDVSGNAIPTSYEDVTDCIVSIQGDVAATTNVPEGSLLISGYSAAGATLTLSGPLKQAAGVPGVEAMTVYKLFNPNDPASPMFRLSRLGLTVTLQEGRWVGGTAPEYITVGTLIIDTIACSNGTVTLTLIDGRNALRGQAYLPPVITPPPYNSQLTNEYAYDGLLRGTRYLSRPALRANCVLSVGMRSSIWPDAGTIKPLNQVFTFGPGKYGTALVNSVDSDGDVSSIIYTLSSPITPSQSSIFMEAFCGPGAQFYVDADFLDTSVVQYLTVYYDAAQIIVSTTTASGTAQQTWTVASTGTPYVACQFHWAAGSTAVTGTIYLDGATHAVSFSALNARSTTANFLLGDAQVDGSFTGSSLEALQVTTESAAAPNNAFVPTLILDPSLNPLVALPDVSDKDIYGALQDAVAAEAGVFLLDELDVAHFVNRETIAAKTSSLTLSSRVNLTGLDSLEQQSTQYTHVQVEVSPLLIAPFAIVWQSSSPIQLAPGVPMTLTVSMDNPAVSVPTQDSGFLVDGPAMWSYQDAYWMACSSPDGLGVAITSGVSFTVRQLSAKVLRITITNTLAIPVFLVAPDGHPTPAGTPLLIVGGQPVVADANLISLSSGGVGGSLLADAQWPPAQFGGAATNPAGDIVLSVSANAWLQDLVAGQALADHYLSDFHVALPLIRNTTIVSDPRTQLIDRVTLADVDVSLASMDALIVGQQFTYGGGSGAGQFWTRSFDLRACWPPGGWVLGVAGMSELGDGSTIQGTAYAY